MSDPTFGPPAGACRGYERWESGWCPPCATGRHHDCYDVEYREHQCECADTQCLTARSEVWPTVEEEREHVRAMLESRAEDAHREREIREQALQDAAANWPGTWMAGVSDPVEAQRLRKRYDGVCVREALEQAERERRLPNLNDTMAAELEDEMREDGPTVQDTDEPSDRQIAAMLPRDLPSRQSIILDAMRD